MLFISLLKLYSPPPTFPPLWCFLLILLFCHVNLPSTIFSFLSTFFPLCSTLFSVSSTSLFLLYTSSYNLPSIFFSFLFSSPFYLSSSPRLPVFSRPLISTAGWVEVSRGWRTSTHPIQPMTTCSRASSWPRHSSKFVLTDRSIGRSYE